MDNCWPLNALWDRSCLLRMTDNLLPVSFFHLRCGGSTKTTRSDGWGPDYARLKSHFSCNLKTFDGRVDCWHHQYLQMCRLQSATRWQLCGAAHCKTMPPPSGLFHRTHPCLLMFKTHWNKTVVSYFYSRSKDIYPLKIMVFFTL